jgi:hypothetical protein
MGKRCFPSPVRGRTASSLGNSSAVLNGTFIEEISELLLSATTTGAKGKTIFEVDNAMEILTENIEKNFNDVPTFLKFMRASMRQVMIRRLAKHSTNKAAWSKAEDFIQDLLQKNTALTLETTQMAIDRAQTYMSREEKLHTSTTLVASNSTDAESEILKAELASLKAGAVAAAGRGTARRHSERRWPKSRRRRPRTIYRDVYEVWKSWSCHRSVVPNR